MGARVSAPGVTGHVWRCGVRLTDKGAEIRAAVAALFERHADDLSERGLYGPDAASEIAGALRRIERYWSEQIRFIY